LTTSRVTVFFKDDKVERFDGGNLPTEKEYIAQIAGKPKAAPKVGPKPEDSGSPSIQVPK
jgi:outer membrane protein assembly factor BamE